MSTNSLLTPCKQGAVLSRYSMALAMWLVENTLSMRFIIVGWDSLCSHPLSDPLAVSSLSEGKLL